LPGSESREDISVEDAWEYFGERFGVSREDLERFEIVKRSGDFWLVSEAEEPDLEYETEGVRFLRDTGNFLKPTTYGLQILGEKISRNRVELVREEFLDLLEGEMVQRELDDKGYVALEYEGRVFGCGLYKDGLVSSRIPKGRGKELRNFL
jgi:NOL1/NOP2/fmu family ribosome biogenesis protein